MCKRFNVEHKGPIHILESLKRDYREYFEIHSYEGGVVHIVNKHHLSEYDDLCDVISQIIVGSEVKVRSKSIITDKDGCLKRAIFFFEPK